MLIISPFEDKIRRLNKINAEKRNEMLINIADEIFVTFAEEGGNVERLVEKYRDIKKIKL